MAERATANQNQANAKKKSGAHGPTSRQLPSCQMWRWPASSSVNSSSLLSSLLLLLFLFSFLLSYLSITGFTSNHKFKLSLLFAFDSVSYTSKYLANMFRVKPQSLSCLRGSVARYNSTTTRSPPLLDRIRSDLKEAMRTRDTARL